MPQIQVLPGVPDFGSQLAEVLNQVGVAIGKGLIQRNRLEPSYKKILNNSVSNNQSSESNSRKTSRVRQTNTKPKFDINNPEHIKIRDEALKTANNDQQKAEKILLQKFSL